MVQPHSHGKHQAMCLRTILRAVERYAAPQPKGEVVRDLYRAIAKALAYENWARGKTPMKHVAIITGASRGIGAATAKLLASRAF